ncbi:uncharacterized protein LOC131050166 isoform X2 [Cryptomeria japonica]|nr:uncharacterized protein LOC131050166 isoform X2 [Cryptomeria japonica]XP_057840334.2 uncharacterized protein LOC131050166 isoform X2 [Cryptomeria japonica]
MVAAPFSVGIEQELLEADILLPSILPFKQLQMSEKYPKGHSRGRHWKHLKQILQAENYHLYPADEPNYLNVESPPSMYSAKKYCDITGFVKNVSQFRFFMEDVIILFKKNEIQASHSCFGICMLIVFRQRSKNKLFVGWEDQGDSNSREMMLRLKCEVEGL